VLVTGESSSAGVDVPTRQRRESSWSRSRSFLLERFRRSGLERSRSRLSFSLSRSRSRLRAVRLVTGDVRGAPDVVQRYLQYDDEAVLGHGPNGMVHLLRSRRHRSEVVVCRLVGTRCEDAPFEAAMLVTHAHAHVLSHLATWLERAEDISKLFVFTEHAAHGSLAVRMQAHAAAGEPVPSVLVARWLSQLASALQHLHGLGIVQRDLHAANIFVADGRAPPLRDADAPPVP